MNPHQSGNNQSNQAGQPMNMSRGTENSDDIVNAIVCNDYSQQKIQMAVQNKQSIGLLISDEQYYQRKTQMLMKYCQYFHLALQKTRTHKQNSLLDKSKAQIYSLRDKKGLVFFESLWKEFQKLMDFPQENKSFQNSSSLSESFKNISCSDASLISLKFFQPQIQMPNQQLDLSQVLQKLDQKIDYENIIKKSQLLQKENILLKEKFDFIKENQLKQRNDFESSIKQLFQVNYNLNAQSLSKQIQFTTKIQSMQQQIQMRNVNQQKLLTQIKDKTISLETNKNLNNQQLFQLKKLKEIIMRLKGQLRLKRQSIQYSVSYTEKGKKITLF